MATPIDSESITHTPGPWLIAFDEPYVKSGVKHYFLEDSEGHQLMLLQRLPEAGPSEHDANARLIAASPELLGALEALSQDIIDAADQDFTPFTRSIDLAAANQHAREARAAIQKARGE